MQPLRARLIARRAVSQKLRDEHGMGGYRRYSGDAMVDALLDSAASATDDDLAKFAAVEV